MKTNTPYIETTCVSETYPSIKGTCVAGTINVYNCNFQLVKSIEVTSNKFFINLEDVESNCYVVTNIESGKEESNYSRITVQCCESIYDIECKPCNKCKPC